MTDAELIKLAKLAGIQRPDDALAWPLWRKAIRLAVAVEQKRCLAICESYEERTEYPTNSWLEDVAGEIGYPDDDLWEELWELQ